MSEAIRTYTVDKNNKINMQCKREEDYFIEGKVL